MAGKHRHAKDPDSGMTLADGPHFHTLSIDGVVIQSELGGEHSHPQRDDGTIGDEVEHAHEFILPNGKEVRTRSGGSHCHLEGTDTKTGDSVPHSHEVEVAGKLLTTDVPAPMEREVDSERETLEKRIPDVREVSPDTLTDLSDGELMELHANLHEMGAAFEAKA